MTLTALAAAAVAGPITLTEHQLDEVTAGFGTEPPGRNAELHAGADAQGFGPGGNPAHGKKVGGGYFANNPGQGNGPVNNPHLNL